MYTHIYTEAVRTDTHIHTTDKHRTHHTYTGTHDTYTQHTKHEHMYNTYKQHTHTHTHTHTHRAHLSLFVISTLEPLLSVFPAEL